jgi:putative ABC transport system permease protein
VWKILLREYADDLKTQKTRVALTMLAITWGTVAVVLLLAFGEGLKDGMMRGFINAGDRIFMMDGGQTTKEFQGLPKGRSIVLTEEDMTLLKRSVSDIGLTSVSYGRSNVSLVTGENKTTAFMEGVEPAFEELRRMFPGAGGRFLNERDLEEKRRVLFLGDKMKERLFADENAVGKTVMVDGLPFTVIGVMQKKMQTSSNNGPDSDRAIIPASTYRMMYGEREVDELLLQPRSILRAERTKQEIYEALGRRHKFDPTDERALRIWDFIEDEKIGRKVMLGIQIFLGAIGGFTLLVAGVGVANIMYVVAKERTREIGVKLAIGARKTHIVSQFVFESLLLSLSGGALGILFSATVVAAVRSIPNKTGPAEFLANPILSWPIAFATVGILAAIGLVAGLFPARKAASIDPVESLRYE